MASGEDQGIIEKMNISGLVTCPLCLGYFQKPKLLTCGHSVCRDCLQIHIDKALTKAACLCPICRSTVNLPNNGVDGLTPSFSIVRLQDEYNKVAVDRSCGPCNNDGANSPAKSKCIECCDYLCVECIKDHRMARFSRSHHIIPIGKQVDTGDGIEGIYDITTIKCHDHQDEIVRFFCLTCQMLICRDCKALDHTDHNAVTFQEAIKGKREVFRSDVSSLQSKRRELSTVMENISRNISTLGSEKNTLIDSIKEERGKLISLINQAADKAIDDAELVASSEIKTQKNELDEAQFLLSQMESHISCANVLLTKGSDVEVLHSYSNVKERSTNLTSKSISILDYQVPTLQLTMDFSIADGLQNQFMLSCHGNSPTERHNLGGESFSTIKMRRRLESLRLLQAIPTPSDGYISGLAFHDNTLFTCVRGKLYRFNGNTLTDISNSYNTEDRAFDVCVKNNTIVVPKASKGRGQNVQLIVSDLTTTGHTTATLPFSSYCPFIACGRSLDGQPTYLVIENPGNNVVHHIDCKGNILQTYGKGELYYPLGLAVDVQGDVVVTDPDKSEVIMFSRDGSVKCRLRENNNLSWEQMSRPYGICVDQEGYMYVSSIDSSSVLMFSPSADYIGTALTRKNGIYSPSWITISQYGRLAVCCDRCDSAEIRVYSYMDSA